MSGKTSLYWQLLANLLQHDVPCELKESEETGQLVVVKKLIGMRSRGIKEENTFLLQSHLLKVII